MSKKWTRSEAFAFFGVKPRNQRWSWSGRSEDGKVVVLTLWQDKFSRQDGLISYEDRPDDAPRDWSNFNGNRERLDNLKWAQDHCDGLFHVVIAIPRDAKAPIREIAECFPQPKLRMRIVHWDKEKGDFRAVSVSAEQ